MRYLLLISSLLIGIQAMSQQILLEIHCLTAENRDSIYDAKVTIVQNGLSQTKQTNKQGLVRFEIDSEKKVSLSFHHGFYGDIAESINPKQLVIREGIAHFQILMDQPKVRNLNTIRVLAPGSSEIMYQSTELSVADFEFMPNGEVLLLLYPKTLKKGGELGILSGGEIVSRFEIPEKPLELVKDFRRNPHVVCEKGVYGVVMNDEGIGLAHLDKTYFMNYVFPIVDTNYSKYYFSTFSPIYPAFDYKSYDQLDSSYRKIIEIKDDLMMELYRSEYKWVDVRTKLWAKNMENETGIDKEIWVGANYFTQSLYYKELYAPMFTRNDSIFVFDYYKDKLFTFNRQGEKTDSVGIYHHYDPKRNGWKRKLLQDALNGRIYAYFEKDGIGSLREINVRDGSLGEGIRFNHRYIDEIAVYDNFAWYIYREFETAQKKFLYRVALN